MAKRKKRARPDPAGPCPCGSGLAHPECCGPLLAGTAKPTRAEQVMRARYSAHVFDNAEYLRRSWHPDSQPEQLAMSDSSERWLGLEVIAIENGGALDAEGIVEFKARFVVGTQERTLHERSRFVRHGGDWVYHDGDLQF